MKQVCRGDAANLLFLWICEQMFAFVDRVDTIDSKEEDKEARINDVSIENHRVQSSHRLSFGMT
ncbi:hypothetical protein GCM10025859_19270 [Alicyclobacillus fastidiosus]|nr:hypothetical protein GCM10025859_19270 [Alicyclobacillus fastidiosus]